MTTEKQEKFDVAIIGVGVGANYGSVLTYYSLYKTIESFGKTALMVSKIGASGKDPELQDNHAIRFANRHYNLSKVYSKENVGDLNDIVDTFILGSDQVWNYGISQHFGKAFYLDFAEDDKRKISYASSFGHAHDFAPADEIPKISRLMERFNAISVREDSGVEIAKNVYGIPAKHVVDPIFLLSNEDFLALASMSERDVSSPYLLAYILDPTPEKKAAIEHLAQKLGLRIRIILDGLPHLFEENKIKMNIEGAVESGVEVYDLLKLYAHCSYVVTDSFHGTVFALKFHKPFATVGNKRRGMVRFDSLFRQIGDRSHFTLDASKIISEDERFLAPLDYDEIGAKLTESANESREWLRAAINKSIRNTISRNKKGSGWYEMKLSVTKRRISDAISGLTRFAHFHLKKIRYTLHPPRFSTDSAAWAITNNPRGCQLAVMSPEGAQRGNLAWCDLPAPLNRRAAYEVSITWSVKTEARSVNLHLRNPLTGRFIVVGTIPVIDGSSVMHTDTISFVVPGESFSQIMLGAVHFTGKDAGTEIRSISVRSINPKSVVPNSPSIPAQIGGKSPASVAGELSRLDSNRFVAAYAQKRISRSLDNSRALMMFYSHGFEKGLSRTKGFRAGFGEATMAGLAREMNRWVEEGQSRQDSFFQISAAVLRTYFDRHDALGVDVSQFWRQFSPSVQQEIKKADATLGGALPANCVREHLTMLQPQRSFVDVAFGRRSVREFTSETVSDDDIQKAVRIAMQAPSVCNRQPVRVHQFDDADTIRAVLELQGGFRGYKIPPKLLLVSSELKAMVGAVERNQAFVDGGLFMMLLLLAFEQLGLGTCSLNTAMSYEREESARRILNIPESQVFISFVAVGHYEESVSVPRSARISVEEVLVTHGDLPAAL